jgi:hypothetical protein
MENRYFCPKCQTALNVGGHIILTAKNKNNRFALILFEEKLGDYNFIKHSETEFENGEHNEFFCPACGKNLKSKNAGLAEIGLTDTEGKTFDIRFSEIAGEKATYKIHGKEIETFGEDSDVYVNHFGIGPSYI